jgi:hypothetical protein
MTAKTGICPMCHGEFEAPPGPGRVTCQHCGSLLVSEGDGVWGCPMFLPKDATPVRSKFTALIQKFRWLKPALISTAVIGVVVALIAILKAAIKAGLAPYVAAGGMQMGLTLIVGAFLVFWLILGVFWLIFPWMVYAKLNALIREQKRTNELLSRKS